jgi:hypothetical protein
MQGGDAHDIGDAEESWRCGHQAWYARAGRPGIVGFIGKQAAHS